MKAPSHTLIALITLASFSAMHAQTHRLCQFSQAEMHEHKLHATNQMKTNPSNIHDRNYQMERALKTVWGSDADYIPKVEGAGEIFTENDVAYQRMHNGVKVHVNSYYDEQWLTDVIYGLKGHHEPQEEKCFYEILKHIPHNATMIELGSYWAYYSLWFATEISGARNYLIEPDEDRLETGRKNFALNDKTGHFFRAFLGVVRDPEPNVNGAPHIVMDDFIKEHNIEHIHILHADIQSAEKEMLEGCVNHLDIIDYFVISTHRPVQDHLACLDFFKKHGFIILAEHNNHESCSGDGLIVAKRPGVPGPDSITINRY